VFDVVVDIRVGSPTYGQWDSVMLDDTAHRSIYISAGLAHAFLALQDDSTIMYLCSEPYSPTREHTIAATDPAIGIDWPLPFDELVLSERDAAADTLAEVARQGLLPTWAEAQAFDKHLRGT
jgi:dTDP-4-dehydrorhamnose 3,5-epimerase